jgi:NTE family protein
LSRAFRNLMKGRDFLMTPAFRSQDRTQAGPFGTARSFGSLLCLLFLGFLCSSSLTPSRADTRSPRPKIGLVLSGGSALGIAHIGVLEWFDRHHIPIDYIAGTSMGGLVGGCYCTGMTPDEMRATLKGIDWNAALSSGPAYETLSFRRKEDQQDIPSRLEVGLRKGVALPAGLTPAGPIGLLLSRVSLPYSEVRDFDDLPTPFRCVALDMGTGQPAVFHDGSLATALRATMSIPAVFTPVERDGHLYTDGGSVENTPTQAVKDMGADIIIAVDLSGGFFEAKPPASLVSILSRTIDSMTYANERRSLTLADIILTPAFGSLTATDFVQVDALADRGFQAADAKAKILERFALSDADWSAYVAQRNARRRGALPPPTFVQTAGVDGATASALQSQLKPFLGKPLDISQLEASLTTIAGDGLYESFQYQQVERDGAQGLLVYANEKKYGPPFLRFGLDINGTDTSNLRTNLVARLTARNVGSPGAETRTDLSIGSDPSAAVEYYRPLDSDRRWFVAPRLFSTSTSLGLYSQGARSALYDDRNTGVGLDLGYNPTRSSEIRLGPQFSYERASVVTGSSLLPSVSGDVVLTQLQWTDNRLDSPIIPSRGQRLHLEADWYSQAPGSPHPFPAAQAAMSSFIPLRSGDTLALLGEAGTTFGGQAAPLQQFTVGGPLRLGAYRLQEFRGDDYLLATPGYLHQIGQLPPFLGGQVMLGGFYEIGGVGSRFESVHLLNDLSVNLISETPLGPVAFGYSVGDAGRNRVFFTVGSFL